MNNLKLSWSDSKQVELQSRDEILFSALDIEHDTLFFASSSNHVYTTKLSFQKHEKHETFACSAPPEHALLDLEDGDSVASFDYLMDREALMIGTSNGQILLYTVSDSQCEVIGKVEGGVKLISPSPDGGVLAIISGNLNLLLMTTEWDIQYEIPHDVNGSSSISWRGDGKYFSTLSESRLKVYERESGTLIATSGGKNFIEGVVDWQPSGAKIATVCDNKTPLIQFFERNGLARSSFELDGSVESIVEDLKWNSSSDLLAVLCRCEEFDCLKIWFFSNNHWYLKQEIQFVKQDKVKFMWNPESALQFICWTLNGRVTIRDFIWVTGVTNSSVALVVDGSRLSITPLGSALIPPPLYYLSMKFSSAIRDIVFSSANSRSYVAVFLSNRRLAIAELRQDWENVEGEEFVVDDCCCDFDGQHVEFRHLAWLDESRLLVLSMNQLELNDYFMEINFLNCDGYWRGKVSHQIPTGRFVISIASSWKKGSAIVQFHEGCVYEYISRMEGHLPRLVSCSSADFLSSCLWMTVVNNGNAEGFVVGLDNQGRLQANGVVLCKNCRSFLFYSAFGDHIISHLIIVTKNDFLFTVEMSDALRGKIEENQKAIMNLWERGAKVVGVIHGDEAAVVIQTNRGNLECIYPRKLVLNSIVCAMNQERWKNVMFMVRRHRINFNIIVDYLGWRKFVGFASDFVKQIENLNWLSEFVCSVKKSNVVEILYGNYLTCSSEDEPAEEDKKVSCVLMAVKKGVEEHVPASPARELCILTTLAKTDPPEVEQALIRIRSIREKELLHLPHAGVHAYPYSDEALKHLLWLCDSDKVYEAALGLYDLNLAAIVALNSQKDPKEFVPFLQELQQKQRFLMHYEIDLKLNRFESALRNLASGGDAYFGECLCLMKDHPELFPLGLLLFKDSAMKQEILEAWGDHAMAEKRFEDAASLYLSSSSFEKALKAYRTGGDWRGAMVLAGVLKYERPEIIQLAHELCDELQALGYPREAANIALNYFPDLGIAVRLLISARDWLEALRLGFRGDLVSEVKTACLECVGMLIDEYKEGTEKIGKYSARYLAVRQRRLSLANTVQSGRQQVNDADDDDIASEASSNFSGMSVYSRKTASASVASTAYSRSSKAKYSRRQRNKGKIRAGSPNEELALVEHLRSMSITVEARNEIKSLLIALVMLGEEEAARNLQKAAEGFQLLQVAAVRLGEETAKTNCVNGTEHTIERYKEKVKTEMTTEDAFSWRSKALISLYSSV